ncbi:hypothetical protein B0H16DRAFT_1480325 [Mycena metata]|uniref:Uncharacterized protein n=1 Tax=Mycena metata TaxID=1033252 RepID=A0AAD7MD39_9AGAR|nr:hypothetical protein B0H16DRAFT_1480325 [Mycena metata]
MSEIHEVSRLTTEVIHPSLRYSGGMRRKPLEVGGSFCPNGSTYFHRNTVMQCDPREMAGIIAQITPPILIGMQRDLAKFTGNQREFLHKYLQSFPAESIETRWATISLAEVCDSQWPGIGCQWNTMPIAADQPVATSAYITDMLSANAEILAKISHSRNKIV